MKPQTVLLVLSLLTIAAILADAKTAWHQLDSYNFKKYTKEFGKTYSSSEYATREALFEKNLNAIRKHNQDSTKTWKQGVNHMTDWTDDERSRLLGYNKALGYSSKRPNEVQWRKDVSIADLPASVDWREKGIISAVKDQGQCGSCWSFGTAETVESHWAQSTGQLATLSEQQILDCTPNPNACGGHGGCEGGTPEIAYEKIISMGGLSSEWTYPYISYFGIDYQCHFNATQTAPVAKIKSYNVLPSNKYEPVLDAIANVGPLAINVDASSWFLYETGVFNGCNQTNPDIDHVVQLVGYGTDNQLGDYWLVRNSWSPAWGERGYIRLARSDNPVCGTDLNPSDGTGCNGGPPTVTVCGTCGILYDVSYPVM